MINLTELMTERSADPPYPSGERLQNVQRRIVVRRRRRIVTGVVGAFLAILSIGYLVQPTHHARPTPVATRVLHGFPEYAHGYRVIAATEGPLADREVSLRWTPMGGDFAVMLDCRNLPGPEQLYGDLMLNGIRWLETGPCGTIFGGSDSLTQLGIPVGTPVTVTYRLIRATLYDEPAMIPSSGQIGLAVKVPVPFSEFPLPPAPPKLPALEPFTACEGGSGRFHRIDSDPADPLRTAALDATWDRYSIVWLVSQTPGVFTISLNGVEVATLTVWDYTAYLSTAELTPDTFGPGAPGPGEQVVLTVTPRHVTGSWQMITALHESPTVACVGYRDQSMGAQLGPNPWPGTGK